MQDYFYQIKKKYISEQDILLPRGFKEVGTLIKEFTGENLSFEELLQGDILYAERVRNKEMKKIERGKEKFSTEDDWIISPHTAIFLGRMCQKMILLIMYGTQQLFVEELCCGQWVSFSITTDLLLPKGFTDKTVSKWIRHCYILDSTSVLLYTLRTEFFSRGDPNVIHRLYFQ